MTKIPANRDQIENICLRSNQSIMKSIHIPPAEVNRSMTVIKPPQVVKNSLMIGSDVVLLRVNTIEDDIISMNYNFIKGGGKIQN